MLTHRLSQATTIMQHGGVVAYSTETVLGLGCDPQNENATKKLLWLKNRGIEKGLIVLVADHVALQKLTNTLTENQLSMIKTSENTTWLIPNKNMPAWITGKHEKIAVRISAHETAGTIASMMSSVVSTSANISTFKTLATQKEIKDWFGPHVDYILINGPGSGVPSKICDLLSGEIIRLN